MSGGPGWYEGGFVRFPGSVFFILVPGSKVKPLSFFAPHCLMQFLYGFNFTEVDLAEEGSMCTAEVILALSDLGLVTVGWVGFEFRSAISCAFGASFPVIAAACCFDYSQLGWCPFVARS